MQKRLEKLGRAISGQKTTMEKQGRKTKVMKKTVS